MTKVTKQSQSPTALKKKIKELEAENMKLKNIKAKAGKKSSWGRNVASAFLVFMSAIMLVSSTMFIWLQKTVLETDVWVDKTSEIMATQSVQADVAEKITAELFAQIDLDQYVQEALPPKAAPLSAPIASGIKGFVEDKTNEVVASDQFAKVWSEANRLSHQSLVNSIERLNTVNSENNSSDVIYINEESLMLNLRPIMGQVKQNLVDRGITFLPTNQVISQDRVTFTIAEINNLPAILGVYNLLNSLSYWLPVMAVVFGAAGVFVASSRRKALMWIVILTLSLAVLVVQVVKVGQYGITQSASSATSALSVESATAIYKVITNDLITNLRWLMGAMLTVGLFLFLSGPSAAATWIRSKVGGLVKDYKTNSLVKFLAKNAYTLIGIVGLFVAALIVLVPFSTPWFAIWAIVFGGLLSIALIAVKHELDAQKII